MATSEQTDAGEKPTTGQEGGIGAFHVHEGVICLHDKTNPEAYITSDTTWEDMKEP